MKMFFNIIFYRFYTFLKAEYNAMYFVVLLITLNLGSFYGYYQCLVNHSSSIVPPKLGTLTIGALLCVIGYFIFIHKNKYKEICQKVEGYHAFSSNKVTTITLLYILVTIIFWAGLIFLDCSKWNIKFLMSLIDITTPQQGWFFYALLPSPDKGWLVYNRFINIII